MPSVTNVVKRLIVGRPFRTETLDRTLLPKRLALPVFSSDALSSIAYAPQEILLTLAAAGAVGYTVSWQVGLVVVVVMAIVITAYRQNVRAYPSGGGDYEIATTNLGPSAGIITASALLVDYVLTVAVSVSAAAQYAASAIPWLRGYEVFAALGAVVILAFVNLRGLKDSGTTFAIPTYFFMACMALLAVGGVVRLLLGNLPQAESARFELVAQSEYTGGLLSLGVLFLILRAFSSGCAALTGVEAISNGVPYFRSPKSKNAATTLAMLGGISITMFLAVLFLARQTGVQYVNERSPWESLSLDGKLAAPGPGGAAVFEDGTSYVQLPVIGQLAQTIFDGWLPIFFLITFATGLILVLAANTAFNGFPVLASVLARDEFMPRQLRSRGDRLVFSNGIIMLSGAAAALIVAFNAEVTLLIHLYIVGVFVAFSVSQLGMVKHWTRALNLEREPRKRRAHALSRVVNAMGFACTFLTLIVVVVSKFTHGAWVTLFAMAAFIAFMRIIRAHYRRSSSELELHDGDDARQLPSRVTAIVLVSRIHRPTVRALAYARASRPSTLEAVAVGIDAGEIEKLHQEWETHQIPVPLKILDSPYRELTRPVVDYIKSIRRQSPRDLVVVYIPEYVVGRWWEAFLHNQSAMRLKAQLRYSPGVIVASVPWQLRSSEGVEAKMFDSSVKTPNQPGSPHKPPRSGDPEADPHQFVDDTVPAASPGIDRGTLKPHPPQPRPTKPGRTTNGPEDS